MHVSWGKKERRTSWNMEGETVDIKIPPNYQGNPVKIFVDREQKRQKDGPVSFISFNIDVPCSSNVIIDGGKMITKEDAYRVLREKGGLSDRIPCIFSLKEMQMIEFDHNPSCYTGPRSFPFKWNGVECSFASPFTIRIHNLGLEEARLVLASIKEEFLKYWKPNLQPLGVTKIYVASQVPSAKHVWQWREHSNRVSRPWETIYLEDEIKKKLTDTLTEFLKSEALYNKYGVTWKKIYLFCGPPGTGKTSTVLAMASHFQKNIARIAIDPGMTATSIENLLSTLPADSFVILEDVDALFVEREAQTLLDFSSLLNALDGITTRRGLVLFMTTNHLEKLDPALMRPGRVDELITFPQPSTNIYLKALQNLAPEWLHEYRPFIESIKRRELESGKPFTIAALQAHLFHCVMEKKYSILLEEEK